MLTGTITRLIGDKGFGFIARDGDQADYFFHRSGLRAGIRFTELREGQRVTFEMEHGEKGPRARVIAVE